MNNNKGRFGIFYEILIYFFIGTIAIGILSSIIFTETSKQSIINSKHKYAESIFDDFIPFMRSYPTIDLLIEYWLDHIDSLDIEYDTTEATIKKESLLEARNPGLVIENATPEEFLALSEEDKKAFAEIVYNEILIRSNKMIAAYGVDYIYLGAVDKKYEKCIFIFSGSDGKIRRSSNYGDAYVLGTTVDVTADQRTVLQDVMRESYKLAESEKFADRYEAFGTCGDYNMFVGLTYKLSDVYGAIRENTIKQVFCTVFMLIIFSLICIRLIFYYVITPLKKVQMSVENYEGNKDSQEVETRLSQIKLRNEIGVLASSFSHMVKDLDTYIEEIQKVTAEKERIGAELNVATRIQEDMLPSIFPPFPDRPEFDVYASMDPAKEVGGDFYDFFMVDDDHIALVMADVSGKGVPAALFMVIAKTLIKTRTQQGGLPGDILSEVNDTLCEGNDAELFVTVWLAIIEISTGKGWAANAGHEHPAIKRKGGDFELSIYKHSPAVATMEGIPFKQHEFELNPGDSLFVYTDGVAEATNSNNELYGNDRMINALNANKDVDLKEALANIRKDIDAFVGDAPQFDDITMLMFNYYGKDGKNAE
jgi:serine phosphatase RsbU (regulator of sigma subunit)